jgi:hypothetical protein
MKTKELGVFLMPSFIIRWGQGYETEKHFFPGTVIFSHR